MSRLSEAQDGTASRNAGNARGSKRKAVKAPTNSDEESSDGFESVSGQDDDLARNASTPEPLEDHGDTTEDSDEADAPEPTPAPEPKKGIKKTLGGRNKDTAPSTHHSASQSSRTAKDASTSEKVSQEQVEDQEIPPRRELPFSRRKAAQEAAKKMSQELPSPAPASQAKSASSALHSSGVGDDDDDTTDDEL